jgi:septal ring factor EnvC (AmiA/AmiB activator)
MVVDMVHGALRAGVLAAGAAGALLASPGIFTSTASAEPAHRLDASSRSTRPRTAAQAERDGANATAQAARLRAQAQRNTAEIAALDQRLVDAGRRRAEAEAAATDAEARLAALRAQQAQDTTQYHDDRNSLESALVAAAFAQRQWEPSLLHIGMMAAAAAPVFASNMHQTSQALEAARQRDAEIAEEERNLVAAQAAIDAERADVITLLAQRRAKQSELVNDADVADERARRFAAEARSLRELAQRLQARSTMRSVPGAPSSIPAAWLAPAEGTIVRPFGVRASGGPAAQGATLRTRANAQVVAPTSGQVAYAGPFRGYGQVLILNRSDGYAVVLAGLGAMRTRVGDRVVAGQPVGEMSSSDTAAPELYVEVRRNGQPIDPARWLAGHGLTAAAGSDSAG